MIYPQEIAPYTKEIASFIVSENDLLRERTANALGRIGEQITDLLPLILRNYLSWQEIKALMYG